MTRDFVPYPFEPVRHAARLPALEDGVERGRHAVVIVGGGPVGLCVALGLASHGVKSVLLEADDAVCAGSRAICISRRSLEIMDRLGALPGFLAIGLPWTGGRSFYRDAEVLRFTMPADALQKLPPMVNLAQYHIEQILLERTEPRRDLIDVRWQTRLVTIAAGEDGSVLEVDTPAGGYRLHAGWVVACDGGRSLVREQLGLKMQGTSYEGRYIIVDIRLASDRPAERLAYFDPPCNPGSTVLVHKQPHDVWRIDYQLRDGEDPDEAIRPENVIPRVQSLLEMLGEPAPGKDWAPIWISMYKANALTLPRFRDKRVLFAGDAAHLMPIFGVRGANSGIDDADNLAWKLAFVVKGLAGLPLLDTYSAERVAAAQENLSHGMKSTEFMAPPTFAFELLRTAVLGLAVKHREVRSLVNPRQTAAIAYDASPLNAQPERSRAFVAGPAPGSVLPEGPLLLTPAGGPPRPGHVTDLLVPGLVALWFADAGSTPAPLRDWIRRLKSRGLPAAARTLVREGRLGDAQDAPGTLFDLMGAEPGTLVLVRPDGHVLARWRGVPLETALAEATASLQAWLLPEVIA
jgi:3-(3-hydroxy-phenyl)propionate hydroxylase